MTDQAAKSKKPEYRVLARKYRPSTFAELIGQDAMVRTLTNAIDSGRLAHAFMLTGVRGIGKTTTARLVARAMNCIGEDGQGGPTITPCGVCDHCVAIAQDRHVDVLEMDAASRTKVEEMRELLDGVRYRPTSARYKIYIIDEVHMLSNHSFNALLKTLEEPPEHVKFIFATTEIRKVPITVLSRCQRFDLRRVDQAELAEHFKAIAQKEGAAITDAALALVARAADGSVRDGLSLLDQAIAHCGGEVGEEQVRGMLGLADRSRTFDLFDAVMQGDIAGALALLDGQYKAGADPVVVLQDMLELAHWLTRLKVAPDLSSDYTMPETERVRGKDMSERLAMAALTRAWQMLLKGLQEAQVAPSALHAAEMVLIRLAYAAELPDPAELVKTLGKGTSGGRAASAAQAPSGGGPSGARAVADSGVDAGTPVSSVPHATLVHNSGALARVTMAEVAPEEQTRLADPQTFEEVVELATTSKERSLRANLINNVHLVHFEPGRIEFHPADHAPKELAQTLSRFLNENTARRWMVSVSVSSGGATLHQQAEEAKAKRKAQAAEHPLSQAIFKAFPGIVLDEVRDLAPVVDVVEPEEIDEEE